MTDTGNKKFNKVFVLRTVNDVNVYSDHCLISIFLPCKTLAPRHINIIKKFNKRVKQNKHGFIDSKPNFTLREIIIYLNIPDLHVNYAINHRVFGRLDLNKCNSQLATNLIKNKAVIYLVEIPELAKIQEIRLDRKTKESIIAIMDAMIISLVLDKIKGI